MKLFLKTSSTQKAATLSEGEIGKPHKYIYMFVIPCAELRFVWNIVNVHVYTVEKF